MGLAWFGNTDWYDDRPPLYPPVAYVCTGCGKEWVWRQAMTYSGPAPKCKDCGAELKKATG